jgi:siroheme synthase-like protein
MLYPVFLDLSGKRCLVVGGGRIALRKVLALLRAKAAVTVVTKECCGRLLRLERAISLQLRPFSETDLTREYMLVIGATDNPEVNRTIFQKATDLNIPCNIVDQPALCSFVVPAKVRRGDVTVAISTNGVSPRLSKYLKRVIAGAVEPIHGELAAYLGIIRLRIRSELPHISMRSAFWEALFANDPVDVIRSHGWEAFRSATEKLIAVHVQQMENNEKK